jgi:hypothetical protein
MFRFIWENRKELGLEEDAYTRVLSVRPCLRTNPDDGFVLRETVAEYYQLLRLKAIEVKHLGIKTPPDMPPEQDLVLYGGAALIFDEFGQLKFNVRNRLLNPERQTSRLKHLWKSERGRAFAEEKNVSAKRFARMHQLRYGTFPVEINNEGAWKDDYIKKDGGPKGRRQEGVEQEGVEQEGGGPEGGEAHDGLAPEPADAP